MEPLAAFAGLMIGLMISALIWGQVILPDQMNKQFKKDCVSMAHGTIQPNTSNVCVKNGRILFTNDK